MKFNASSRSRKSKELQQGSVLSSVLELVRWKTLGASLAPAIVVLALAVAQKRSLALIAFFCCGPSPFLVQIGTNLVNDAYDFQRGVDGSHRLGPKRVSTRRGALLCHVAGILCFPVAILFSLPAIRLRGIIVLELEVVCSVMGYLYTGGPFPYGYYAFGEVGVLSAFGILYVALASYIIQGGAIFEMARIVAGSQLGCMAINMLVINNLRDMDTDRVTRKYTVSNLLGYEKGRWELVWTVVLAHLLGIYWAKEGFLLAFVLPLLTIPFAISSIRDVFATKPSGHYNLYLQRFAQLHLAFAGLLAMGLISPRLFNDL